MAKKTWLEKHWDEAILIGSIILALYFILKGTGYIT